MIRFFSICLLLNLLSLAAFAEVVYDTTSFDTTLIADFDTRISFPAASCSLNYGIRDSMVAGNSATSPYSHYAFLHYNLTWLPQGIDTTVIITSALDCVYTATKTGTPELSCYAIGHDWFEGTYNGVNVVAAATSDSQASCGIWAGWSKSGGTSVCGQTIPRTQVAWSNPIVRTTPYDTVHVTGAMWCVFDNIVPLVQGLINARSDSAFGIAIGRPAANENESAQIRTRSHATTAHRPRLRVAGYYVSSRTVSTATRNWQRWPWWLHLWRIW